MPMLDYSCRQRFWDPLLPDQALSLQGRVQDCVGMGPQLQRHGHRLPFPASVRLVDLTASHYYYYYYHHCCWLVAAHDTGNL